jgi:hypothetical protein
MNEGSDVVWLNSDPVPLTFQEKGTRRLAVAGRAVMEHDAPLCNPRLGNPDASCDSTTPHVPPKFGELYRPTHGFRAM